jgi:hypothetical protein
MVFDMLGHAGRIVFLEGVGVQQSGYELTSEPFTLTPGEYQASPRKGRVVER